MDDISDFIGAAERTEICLASLPGFNSPKQVRTQKKTDLIVSAAAHLLQERRFSHISMQDIAQRAGCAVTAIYARFNDKDALLPAVHLILLEQKRFSMRNRLTAERYRGKAIEDFSADFVELQEIFYLRNGNFFKAVARSEGDYIFSQMATAAEEWAAICNEIVPHLLGYDQTETMRSLKFAINQIGAAYRDRVITGDHLGPMSRSTLAALFSLILRTKLSAQT